MARHREFNKEKALQQAMEVFWAKGYEATSVQDLLDAMGIHRGSMYDTFGDKKALYLATLKHYQSINYEALCDLFSRVESAFEALTIFLHSLMERGQSDNPPGCFMNNAMVETATQDQDVATITSRNTNYMIAEIGKLMQRGQEQGEIRRDQSATALARYLYSAVQGMKVMSKNGADSQTLENIIDVTLLALKA